jgi:hypothetical protein
MLLLISETAHVKLLWSLIHMRENSHFIRFVFSFCPCIHGSGDLVPVALSKRSFRLLLRLVSLVIVFAYRLIPLFSSFFNRHLLSISLNYVTNNLFDCLLFALSSSKTAVALSTGYLLDDREVEVRDPVGSKFAFYIVHKGRRVHPTSYPLGTGCSFPGVKLTTYLQLMPRSRTCIHPFSHKFSWSIA